MTKFLTILCVALTLSLSVGAQKAHGTKGVRNEQKVQTVRKSPKAQPKARSVVGKSTAEEQQNAQQGSVKAPVISFEAIEYNLGQFALDKCPMKCSFKFKNTGNANLVITKVHAFCDCITASYPEKFIAPGETGEIKVSYNGNHSEKIFKTIQVFTNCENQLTRLTLKGELIVPDKSTK